MLVLLTEAYAISFLRRGLSEEGFGVGVGVEGDEVVDLLAGADEADGEAEFAGDGDDDAALGGAIELGEDDAGDANGAGKFAGLGEAVLSGGGVEDEKDVVRGAGDDFGGGALHFFEFGHEIGLGVETAGGVNDDGIGFAGLGGGDRVEDDGGRVGAGFLLDDFYAVALRPDFKLLDGGGAENDAVPLLAEAVCELADAGGLAGAIDADDENDAGIGAI